MANKRFASFESISTTIIEAIQPNDTNGGVFQFIVDLDPLTKGIPNFGKKVFDFVYYKGNYDVLIISGAVWCMFLPICALLCLLWSWYASRSTCCSCNTKVCIVWKSLMDRVYRVFQSPKKKIPSRGKKKSIRVGNEPSGRQLKCFLVFIIITLLCFFSFMMIAYSTNNPLQWTMDDTEVPSLKGSLNESMNDVARFLSNGIEHGSTLTNKTVNAFSSKLQIIIKKAVVSFTDGLMIDFGVTALFDSATKVIDDIKKVLAAMQYIRDSQIKTFRRKDEFIGFINTVRKQLVDLDKICEIKQPYEQRLECIRLKGLRPQLTMVLNQSRLNFESSTSMLFLLRETSLNISSVAGELTKARDAIDSILDTVYVSIQKDFNLDAIFGTLDTTWEQADQLVYDKVIIPMANMQDNGTIDYYINFVSSGRKVTISVIGFFFFLIIVGVTCLIVMIISVHTGRQQQQEKINLYALKNETDDFYNDNDGEGSASSGDSLKRLVRVHYNQKIPVNCFSGFLLFLGFLILIPALIVVASLLIGGLMQTEICRYVEPDNIDMTDSIIDQYLTRKWKSLTKKVNTTFGPGITVKLKQPRNILNAVSKRCANSSIGLLEAVGFQDLLDIDSILKSPMFAKMIGSGKVLAKKQIGDLNIAKMLPSSLTPILKEAINLTKMLVDDIEYKKSITELRKPLLRIGNYTKFIYDLDAYVKIMYAKNPFNRDLIFIARVTPLLLEKHREYLELRNEIRTVLDNFIFLQKTRTISSGLARLIGHFGNVKAIMSNPKRMTSAVDPLYDGVMNWTVIDIGEVFKKSIKSLEKELLPCRDIHKAYQTTINCVCRVFLPEFNAFSFCYGCCIISFQFLFVMLWLLLRKIRRQQLPTHSDC